MCCGRQRRTAPGHSGEAGSAGDTLQPARIVATAWRSAWEWREWGLGRSSPPWEYTHTRNSTQQLTEGRRGGGGKEVCKVVTPSTGRQTKRNYSGAKNAMGRVTAAAKYLTRESAAPRHRSTQRTCGKCPRQQGCAARAPCDPHLLGGSCPGRAQSTATPRTAACGEVKKNNPPTHTRPRGHHTTNTR